MKQAMILLLLLVGAQLAAQDKSTITVKGSEVVSGVVIINALQPATADQATKSTFELHCNKGASACKAVDPGTYLMVRLPKNWGMYDCADVDLYAATANPDTDQKIGEYCLIEK